MWARLQGLLLWPRTAIERRRARKVMQRYAPALRDAGLENVGDLREVRAQVASVLVFSSPRLEVISAVGITARNAVLTEMIDVIGEHRGIVDTFLPEGLMVFWGMFDNQPDHARQACSCALEIARRFDAHCAVGTGEILFGNAGSPTRLSFTGVGATVSLTNRTALYAERHRIPVLIGTQTHAAIREEFASEPVAPLRIEGRSEAVQVYRLLPPLSRD